MNPLRANRHCQTVWSQPGTVQRISRPFEQDAVAL